MSAPEYRIESVADFAKVPPKRLKACLREFAVAIESARAVQGLLQTTQKVLQESGDMATGELVAWPMQAFTWIDDKAKTMTVKLSVGPARTPTTGTK